jgi:predicted glycosyltransferase involved in capsule biosynthesis
MVTFIAHIRKDTEERAINLSFILPYYRKIAPGCKFIIVEDDSVKNFEYLSTEQDIEYYYTHNTGSYNKCAGYNYGLSKCTDGIVCFIDIDCIISDTNLNQSLKTVNETNGICIGYNGVCIYFDYSVKKQLLEHKQNLETYDWLNKFIDKNNLTPLYTNEHYHIANLKAVGGSLFGKKETFTKIGGFNPNFTGWGYEDNEIIQRANKLGIEIYYINTLKPYLFHLPHIGEANKNKEHIHPTYQNNENEYSKVLKMSKSELEKYILKW